MSLSNAEEKKWLSTVIQSSLDRAIYKLESDARPRWAREDGVREFLTQIVSNILDDEAWPIVLESCKSCAANHALREDECGHVLVVVHDEPTGSNLLIVDSPTFFSHEQFDRTLKVAGTEEETAGVLLYPGIQDEAMQGEQVKCRRFDIGPAVIKALRELKKIDERGKAVTP
jgi:hypothetical protein